MEAEFSVENGWAKRILPYYARSQLRLSLAKDSVFVTTRHRLFYQLVLVGAGVWWWGQGCCVEVEFPENWEFSFLLEQPTSHKSVQKEGDLNLKYKKFTTWSMSAFAGV